eukprot:scaffold1050_cov51-Cylindrotheca_fusiformis.AAC.3
MVAKTTTVVARRGNTSSSSLAQVLSLFFLLLLLLLVPWTAHAYLEESELSNDDELTLELWRIVDQQAKLKNDEQEQEQQEAFSERTLLGAIGHFRTTTTISSSSTDEDSSNNNSQSCAARNEDTQQKEDDEMNNCQDRWKDDRCEAMAKRGECLYRYKDCPKTCLLCNVTDSIFKIGEAQSIPQNVIQEVQEYHHTTTSTENEDWKLSNITTNEELLQRTAQIILDTQDYMSNIVMQENEYGPVRRSCLNYDAHCSAYAALGYCHSEFSNGNADDDDFITMMANCAPACQTCHELIHVQPCQVNFHHNVIHEGDLEIMFRSMAGEDDKNQNSLPYKPKIFSRPGGDPMDDTIIDGAWLIALEDFLSNDECNHLIEMGAIRGYERSYLQDEDDVEEYRTSVNSWCEEECANDPIVQTILNRISDTTGIPSEYSEPLQMLRYTKGQYYKVHHDVALDSEFQLLYGPRILTFFLYLNDVEEGGATRMIDITDEGDDDDDENGTVGTMEDDDDDEEEEEYDDDSTTSANDEEDEEEEDEPYIPTPIEVQPKRGMAVVWANLKDDDMKQREAGTWHEAMPVIKGVKYGANAWYRLRRFEEDCDEEDFQEWKLKHNIKVMTMEENDDSDDDDENDENPKAADDTTTTTTTSQTATTK